MADQDEFASGYDDQAARYKWYGPDVLFGLMYEFIGEGQSLLDIGIGTGLSSVPFQKAGLTVFGVDGSEDMLAACRLKEIADELIEHDIRDVPLPFPPKSFDHIISLGVLQMLPDLTDLFAEVARLSKDLGTFGFTYQQHIPGANDSFTSIRDDDVAEGIEPDTGLKTYRHRENYVMDLLFNNGFTVWKTQEFVANVHPTAGTKYYSIAVVAQMRGDRVGRSDILDEFLEAK